MKAKKIKQFINQSASKFGVSYSALRDALEKDIFALTDLLGEKINIDVEYQTECKSHPIWHIADVNPSHFLKVVKALEEKRGFKMRAALLD